MAKDLIAEAFTLAVNLFRRCSESAEDVLGHSEGDFAFAGEHFVGAGSAHNSRLSQVMGAGEDAHMRVQTPRDPNDLGGLLRRGS